MSSFETAWTTLQTHGRYADLSQTQYWAGLELLIATGLVSDDKRDLGKLSAMPLDALCGLMYREVLQAFPPAWLADSDILISDSEELPNDAIDVAEALGIDGTAALGAVRAAHGKVDTSLREEVGQQGELLLVDLLEAEWPGSTAHVALLDDGAGYDVSFSTSGCELHLEVKTTTRRGRLVIYVSRHEHEVALRDPHWRLVVVGLSEDRGVGAIASVSYRQLARIAPTDRDGSAEWQSARFEIGVDQTLPGIPSLPAVGATSMSDPNSPLRVGSAPGSRFGWLNSSTTHRLL